MNPWLPAILDEDSLGAIATLETDELTFLCLQSKTQRQYLSALYLKAAAALGHAHFQPKDLPRQFRQRFAEQARRYTAPGILQLKNRAKSRTLQYCFLVNRNSLLLDASADMTIRIRDNMLHTAANHANSRQRAMSDDYEQYRKVLSTLLAIIRNSCNPEELWLAVHQFKSLSEYDELSEALGDVVSWNACYLAKIEDHYT